MFAYSVFEYSDMITAHSLITLAIYAKLADDCLLYVSFHPSIYRRYFFMTTMNVQGGKTLVAVFAQRKDNSCTM